MKPEPALAVDLTDVVLNTIQHPVIMIGADDHITYANNQAESFFGASAASLQKKKRSQIMSYPQIRCFHSFSRSGNNKAR